MSKRRWPVLLGPPLLFLAAVAAVLGLNGPPAKAGASLAIPHLGACAPGHAPGNPKAAGWWKILDRTDAAGTLSGRQLFVGSGSTAAAGGMLKPESSVSGPVNGLVAVTQDDGAGSILQLADVGGRCVITIDERSDVIRNAIIDPTSGDIFAHVVARGSRADLGTFRFTSGGGGHWTGALVAGPLTGALATEVGQVFGTGLAVDAGSHHLAVQSCTDLACLTRVFDLARPGGAAGPARRPPGPDARLCRLGARHVEPPIGRRWSTTVRSLRASPDIASASEVTAIFRLAVNLTLSP